MNKFVIILSSLILFACNNSKLPEYQQSICSVDKKGFAFKADKKPDQSHTLKIFGNQLQFTSSNAGKFTNTLVKTSVFAYSGTEENGSFSYKNNSMSSPLELGTIHFYCWKALKNKYNSKLNFNEILID